MEVAGKGNPTADDDVLTKTCSRDVLTKTCARRRVHEDVLTKRTKTCSRGRRAQHDDDVAVGQGS